MEQKMYRYMECGLDNVFIEGLVPDKDDEGDDVITIPNVTGLHQAIAETIVAGETGMRGAELRFIRTEMGMTQAQLAKVLHHDTQTIGRWERNEFAVDQTAEALIRLLAIEQLGLTIDGQTISAISERCVPSAAPKRIVIDGSDPAHYRQAA